jgi:hypothetical protein
MRGKRVFLAVALAAFGALGAYLSGAPIAAHGGGLDRYGCHHDRKAGTYHCHRGPCTGKTFATQAAMLADNCSKG